MLSDSERELIARAVGGRLPGPDAQRMKLLLEHSREARRLTRALRRERESLQHLSTSQAPPTILPHVMSRIAGTNPFETIPTTRAQLHHLQRHPFVQVAIVASIILAFASMLALWHRSTSKSIEKDDLAQALPKIEFSTNEVQSEPRVVVSLIPDFQAPDPQPEPKLPVAASPPSKPVEKPRPIFGAPYVAPPRVETVLAQLPPIVPMKEIGILSVRKQLVADLMQANRARIDLFVSDSVKAAELLVTTGRAEGINVAIDSGAKERQRQKIPTTWLIYTESLSPEEAIRWMNRLANADNSVFGKLHLIPATLGDTKELKEILGLDLSKPAKSSESTTARRGKDALLVSYLPATARTSPGTSTAVKTWMDRRGERASGKVALSIVVRSQQ